MCIKKEILKTIKKRITTRDKIKCWIFKRYTFEIYKMGYNDAYEYSNKS